MLMLIFITVVLSLFIIDVHYILQIAPILPEIPKYDNYCFDLFCIDEYGNWQMKCQICLFIWCLATI